MKCLILALFFAAGVMANVKSSFDILPGKLHKGGSLAARAEDLTNSDLIVINFAYEIFKKSLVPVPNEYLKGNYKQKLPAMFLDERGYLELETLKAMKIDDATVVHEGRTNYREFNDAHLIHILPDNKKAEIFLVFHPQVSGLGWDQIKLILHTGMPLLDNYMLEAKSK